MSNKKIVEYSSEFLGTFVFTLSVFLAVVLVSGLSSFMIGFAFAAVFYAFSRYSQGHFNPIITIGAFISKRIGVRSTVAYLIVQLIATAIAFGVAFWIRDQFIDLQLILQGAGTTISKEEVLAQVRLSTTFTENFSALAFVIEAILSFALVTIYLMTTGRENDKNSSANGFVVGVALFVFTAFAAQISGASFHPFRSLVSAISEQGDAISQLPIYLLAPTLGGVLAGGVNLLLERLNESSNFGLKLPKVSIEKK